MKVLSVLETNLQISNNNTAIEKTLALLEYGRIRECIASYALSAEAAREIRQLYPLFDPEKVRALKQLVMAFCTLINTAEREKQQELPEIGFLFPRLALAGSILETDEILALGLFLERGGELRRFIVDTIPQESETGMTELRKLAQSIPDCSSLVPEIFRIIDRDGTIRDLPEIKKIRRKIRDLSKELERCIAAYNANENTRRMLQSELPSQRDGRLVLAVKANFRNRIKGIVHEVSASGQTIFIEPEESVEKNNQILVETAHLQAEITKLLKALSGRLAEHRIELEEFHRTMVYMETLRARARYSLGITAGNKECCFAIKAHDSVSHLKLRQARHPLIGSDAVPPSKAVPIDLSLESSTRMVIITGPNTGGKTVSLKTIGLFALMNQTGLALPAAEAVLPIFDAVYADIGDEQSISQSLSTFSAHMINIAGIIQEATEHSLVLLDELGAGTDPEEGNAIAMAILDHFIETKNTVVLTTHHGILKNYGYSRAGVENASVEFDSRTLSPTYRIIMGIPGESRALDIALRNGFPAGLVENARSYLDEERSDMSALIAGLKEKHRELDMVSRSAKEEQDRLREDRRRTDLKELSLRQKEYFLKQQGLTEFQRFLAESRKLLENLVREIREGELNREKTLKVKDFIRQLEEQSAAMEAVLETEELSIMQSSLAGHTDTKNTASKRILTPGIEVFAGPSRLRGKIIREDTKKTGKKNRHNSQSWIVEIGSVRTSFSEQELVPADEDQGSLSGMGTVRWAAELAPAAQPVKLELNLLGMRLEEALEALRRQIDGAVLTGLREFSIVHGKGDGILQKGIQDYLQNESAVAEYHFSRPELGGSGRTEVILQ